MKHEITLPLISAFSRRAANLGYDVRMANADSSKKQCLIAYKGQQEICIFDLSGGMRYLPDNPLEQERKQLHSLLLSMKQAHDLYGDAKPLPVKDNHGYRLISSFGDALLAAKMTDDEVRFTTWEYDYDRTGLYQGHYYETNYEGAKLDFAVRAGLIREEQLFSVEELTALHNACIFRGQNDGEITYDEEKALNAVMEKVEDNLPEPVNQPVPISALEQEDEHGIQ